MIKRIEACVGFFILGLSFWLLPNQSYAQWSAWDMPSVTEGNHVLENGYGVGQDFKVTKSVLVSSLGIFDDGGDGIKGQASLIVHLYASDPDRARKNDSGTLLETVVFDASDPGVLVGSFRYKQLVRPVTLLPGQYTITAEGFDQQNQLFKTSVGKSSVTMNDGGGLIQFEGDDQYHVGYFLKRTRTAKEISQEERAPDTYAAASFIFSAAPPVMSRFSEDYSALISGVPTFPLDNATNKNLPYSPHYGSLSILGTNSFPVLVEPSGGRLVFEAAGEVLGSRCVAFSHLQWGHALQDRRINLFENAILWAAHKTNPGDVVVGLSTNLDASYFASRGYQVRMIDSSGNLADGSSMSACDVLVLDFDAPFDEQFNNRAVQYIGNGGNLVATFLPWKFVKSSVQPAFLEANLFLEPFGMAYRTSLTQPNDLNFTNITTEQYPENLFQAFAAADLLGKDRQGLIQLDSLQTAIALNTISYAADGQPELLAKLSEIYSGVPNDSMAAVTGQLGSFTDSVVLNGVQADTNYLGTWQADDTALLSESDRGSVQYDFSTATANLYRVELYGYETGGDTNTVNPDLLISIDGIPLGQFDFEEPYGSVLMSSLFGAQPTGGNQIYQTSDHVEALTPFLKSGKHVLKIFWNNHDLWAQLHLQNVHVQAAAGADADGDGIVDWVKSFVNGQSGLDSTNTAMTSLVSPICIEGRDPFLSLMQIGISGSDKTSPSLLPAPEPNDRWYVNVPLSANGASTFYAGFQNGEKFETRQIDWLPVNILNGGSFTLRTGDSLLLNALPTSGTVALGSAQITIGTNQLLQKASAPVPYLFARSGPCTVTATYTSADGTIQSGSITVDVVQQKYFENPDSHVGEERIWRVAIPQEATMQFDQRLTVGQMLQGESQTTITTGQSEPLYVISRLGTNGPVLTSWTVRGFDFWEGLDTYLRVVKSYPDGSQLMEMLLVENPVLPDLTAQIDIVVGGVVFDDGTTSKTLGKSDFDALGRAYVHFIHAPTSESAVCHTVELLQGKKLAGKIW